MAKLALNSTVKLNNGVRMPLLGIGTWRSPPGKAEQAVLWALEAGYRHIDTAAIYKNEESVGAAIKKSGIPRKELFVTTKLWNDDHGDVEGALDASLKRLGLDYVDLYLMHWPVPEREQSWKTLEKLYKAGKCRAIGVSNFTIRHLDSLLKAAKVVPAVNQVEFNPFLYQKELLEHCKSKGIQLEAYSPLAQGEKLKDKGVAAIAAKYGRSNAQVMIRWALQHGLVAIPKSVHRERIIENADVFGFEVSAADMKLLDSLNENLRLCWDPTRLP